MTRRCQQEELSLKRESVGREPPRLAEFPPKKSEDPEMDAAAINELLKNAIDQANAEAEQKLEERLTALIFLSIASFIALAKTSVCLAAKL